MIGVRKPESMSYHVALFIYMTIRLAVLIKHWLVSDGRTDGQTRGQYAGRHDGLRNSIRLIWVFCWDCVGSFRMVTSLSRRMAELITSLLFAVVAVSRRILLLWPLQTHSWTLPPLSALLGCALVKVSENLSIAASSDNSSQQNNDEILSMRPSQPASYLQY